MTSDVKTWNAALDLILVSLARPDHELRATARDDKCCKDLDRAKELVVAYVHSLRQ